MKQRIRRPGPYGDFILDIDHGPASAISKPVNYAGTGFHAIPLNEAMPITTGIGKITNWAERQAFRIDPTRT